MNPFACSSSRQSFAARAIRLAPRPALPLLIITASLLLTPDAARGCACGCGVFDVATSSMLPTGRGGLAYFVYNFQNQDRNWSGGSRAPGANNPDRQIETDFGTAGVEFLFNRGWGLQLELPYDHRRFRTTGGPDGQTPVTLNWSGWGDVRLRGIYTGFSPDLSVGVNFGVKLPTGAIDHNDLFGDIDRDTELGTGSTDLLLGGFFRHQFARAPRWTWFAQAQLDQPVLVRDQYRPGAELDSAVGLYHSGWSLGSVSITPVGQVIASDRGSDTGSNAANPVASGYQRVMLSPGLEVHLRSLTMYADAEWPIYQHFNGNQLAAPMLIKVIVSHAF